MRSFGFFNGFLVALTLVLLNHQAVRGQANRPVNEAALAPGNWSDTDLHEVIIKVSDSASFCEQVRREFSELRVKPVGSRLFVVTGLRQGTINRFRQVNPGTFIDRGHRKAVTEAAPGNADLAVNRITTAQAKFPTVSGRGLVVSVKEKPFDQDDMDFRGRVVSSQHFDEPASLHATYMATLAAGAGNTEPSAKGGGWSSGITTSDFSRLLPDPSPELSALSIDVQNHSYGVGVENFYGVESAEYDAQVMNMPNLVHVFSSGNEGSKAPTQGAYAGIAGFANLTGQFKVSKNTLTVGSADRWGQVASASSRGPAHDGRVKPELIAYGDSGSSESAAVISGVVLMVQDRYQEKTGQLPPAAMVKAILINTAHDAGRPEVDFETGFGNADAFEAVKTVDEGRFLSGESTGSSTAVFPLIGEAGKKLKVTLAWSDPPALPFAAQALVNDLDLEVVNLASGDRWDPWVLDASPSESQLRQHAQRGKDRRNNVEQVTIDLPAAGDYEIRVHGFSVPQGPQAFSIAWSMENELTWTYPLASDALKPDTTNMLRWNWHGPPTVGVLESRFEGQLNWKVIAPTVNLADLAFAWAAPDTAAVVHFRLTAGASEVESPLMAISPAQRVRVGYDCEDKVMMYWRPVENATAYRVYSLGEKYLGSPQDIVDTLLLFQKPLATSFFTVVPMFGSTEGARERTVDFTRQAVGCYFSSFLASEYVVNDTARFNVTIGTTYRVMSLSLIRTSDGPSGFHEITTVRPVASNRITLVDPNPLLGSHGYRARLVTQDGLVLVSEEERVLFVTEDDMYVYPNPVRKNDFVNVIIVDSEAAVIQLLNSHGQVVRAAEDQGPEKSLGIEGLDAGLYLLRVQRQNGKVGVRRLVVMD